MPYRSAKQRAWMHIHEPEVAARWDRKYGGGIMDLARNPKRKTRKRRRKRARA